MRPFLFALVAATLALPAYAAEPTNMMNVDGTCESLVVDGIDLTDDCQGKVLQMIYDIGRVGLYAFSGETVVTFSGTSDEVIDNVIHQDLDKVLISTSGDDTVTVVARGTCTFENPYQDKPARFTCSARAKSGATYEFSFLSDGKAPVDMMAD